MGFIFIWILCLHLNHHRGCRQNVLLNADFQLEANAKSLYILPLFTIWEPFFHTYLLLLQFFWNQTNPLTLVFSNNRCV